jgi:hypothetical protein
MPTDRREYLKEYRSKYKARTKRVTAAFSRDEYARIEAVAEEAGLKIAALVRERALGEISMSPPSSSSSKASKHDDAREVIFLLRNIANNINQMAYHSNRLRTVLDENEPLLALQRLEDELTAFLKRQRHDH